MDQEERTGARRDGLEQTGGGTGVAGAGPLDGFMLTKAELVRPDHVYEELRRLQELTFSDMAALAWVADEGREHGPYVWTCVVGSRNDRYRRMSFRRGSSGLAGTALKLGRYVTADMERTPAFARECPVMLAEKLQTALALPVPKRETGEAVSGVLLLGSRSGLVYGQEVIEQAEAGAFRLIR